MNQIELALFAPILTKVWTDLLYPELQKLEGQIKSADLQLVATTIASALNTIAVTEIPKI